MQREEYLERTRALVPDLRNRARQTEIERRLPDASFKAFQEAGLLRALQPERWGGFELDPLTLFEATLEVAPACASSAWVLGVLAVHHWQLALFPEQAQQDVWGSDSSAQISSSYAPTGTIERVDGGFRVSGRWSFSSGCDHCQWVFLGGIAPGADGPPDMRTYLLPRSDYEIDDNWQVAGLSGTGSKDIVVDGAFVPEHRTLRFIDSFLFRNPGTKTNPGPAYRHAFPSVFAQAISVPAIGAAQGALDAFTEQARERVGAHDRAKASGDMSIQLRLAESTAAIDAARARLYANWNELRALIDAGHEIPITLRARVRFDAAHAVGAALRVVDRLMEASGGRGIFLSNPIQRAFRDVHAMRAHAINNPDKGALPFARLQLDPDGGPGDLFV